MPSKATASASRQNFADIVNRAAYGGERTIVHRRKKPMAAVIPIQDLEFLEAVEDRMDIEEARRRLKDPNVPWSTIKKKLGL
jgi:prevent-host-death family protein